MTDDGKRDDAPEKIGTAETVAVEVGVPNVVTAAVAEPIVAPVEVAKTQPVEAEPVAAPPPVRPKTEPPRRSQPAIPIPPVLPTPTEAALEAARIVSEMVDIDSESGAVIAAAAAAGAAIEAAVAAQKVAAAADAASRAEAEPGLPGEVPVLDVHAPADPVTTVRLSRDRILQALSDEEAAQAGGPRQARARTEPGATSPAQRAQHDPGAHRARRRR